MFGFLFSVVDIFVEIEGVSEFNYLVEVLKGFLRVFLIGSVRADFSFRRFFSGC